MKFPNWLKIVWWLLLLVADTTFLVYRYDFFKNNQTTALDVFLFLLWIILALLPIIKEVKFFGISVKKELDDLKDNIDVRFRNLSAEIKNTVNVNPIFNFNPPTDEGVRNIEDRFRNAFTTIVSNVDTTLDVPENNIYLFKMRYEIEKELRRIIQKYKTGYEPIHAYNMSILLSDLFNYQIISGDEASALRDIIGICNFGIHNKPVTPIQVDFVKDIGEKLIDKLRSY